MTKRKALAVANEIKNAIAKEVQRWREQHRDLASEITVAGASIQVRIGNPKRCTCLCNKPATPQLTEVQKKDIRNFFDRLFMKLAEMFNVRVIARQLQELGTQFVCLFEAKSAAVA